MRHKRLSLLVLSVLVISGFVILATRRSSGETNFSAQGKQMKVLRRKGHLGLGPTAQEMAFFRKSIQEEERLLEDQLPKHLPIKIKIKPEKEKGFKDLKNESWARDFILEVTNTGDKSIYYLSLNIWSDVKTKSGQFIVFGLRFGQDELGDIRVKSQPGDMSIKPGETYGFTIHPGQLEAWEFMNRKENRPPAKKLRARFDLLSFGDGTGYAGTDGLALPRKLNERSSLDKCVDQPNRAGPPALEWATLWDRWPSKLSVVDFTGELLAGKFFYTNSARGLSFVSNAAPQSCCPGDGCTSLIPALVNACVNCPTQQRPGITFCGDPAGGCWSATYGSMECFLGNGQEYVCQVIDLNPCGAAPAPTPVPNPTPTPTPTPETCDPALRPNSSNCVCNNVPGIGLTWQCSCGTMVPADYVQFPQSGGCDPAKQANNGSNCCVCISQNVPCDPGFIRNSFDCECRPNLVAVPSPTPAGGGGGDPYNSCTTYYWVLYECLPVGETDWSCREVTRWEAGCW